MAQSREAALAALESVISATMAAASVPFDRDPEKSVDASHAGFVVMRNGDAGQPEYLLSPFACAWEHQVEFEIAASGPDRRSVLEAIIGLIEPALAADRTLGGAVDDARVTEAPEISEIATEDVETERSAVVHVQLSYTTPSGAG